MLNRLDDFPVHQTPEPLAHPASGDRNVYDRTFFNGYTRDGSCYFGLGMAIYPHRGVLDCAFSFVRKDAPQTCFFASRRAPLERTDMTVGPFTLQVLEPMRRARVLLDDNASGLGCDLTFSARTAPIQEARQTLWSGARRVMDATRFAQFGCWSGQLRHPEGEIRLNEATCLGTKDRSWGLRPSGEPETGGAPVQPGGVFFLWAPLIWNEHVSHAVFFDGEAGQPLVREALEAPWHATEEALPDTGEEQTERKLTARHRVRYHPGTRLAARAELDLVGLDESVRTLFLAPQLTFMMKGLGYGHPEWRHGQWKGELALGHESFDVRRLDLLALENLHVQQLVQAEDGDETGVGVLEQLVFGPYAPAGFKTFADGSRPA